MLKEIKKNLQAQKNQIAIDMMEGRMSDFVHYMKSVGIADGLNMAEAIIDETKTKLEREDD